MVRTILAIMISLRLTSTVFGNSTDRVETFDETQKKRIELNQAFEDSFEELPAPQEPPEAPIKTSPPGHQEELTGPKGLSLYFTRLRNAYSCFKEYISLIYSIRSTRDEAIIQCTQNSNSNCDKIQIQAEQDIKGAMTKFKTCLDTPRQPELHKK